MKKLSTTLCVLFSSGMMSVHASAAEVSSLATDTLISASVTRQKVVEKGGGGLYRSIVVTDKNLSDYTIYRPRDVKWAAKHEGKLPLLVWANGACSDDNKGYENMLSDLASHGYVVIALGKMRMDDNDASGGTSGSQHVAEAINWMVKQVSNTKSDYYKAVDVNKVALSGHSCGGAEAIANCGNSRVKTLMIMNAGMGGMSMGGASPQSLKSLHCPIIYLTGGPGDVAYDNAKGDFNNITKVPVVWADLSSAGHGGTYWHHHGGDFERIALRWMDWHLKGKTQNASVFLKPDYADFAGWKFENRNFTKASFAYDEAYTAGITVADTIFNHDEAAEKFAFGADVSSTSQFESGGRTYYDRKGKKGDLMSVLKGEGMNAVRFRVWVNPEENWNNKADVLKLCSRAKKQKLDIMIDFHYSDFWANGGNQFKPAKWEGHDVEKLITDVYDHTFDVLNTLKKSGIKVRWAQIGNDVENGMLWGDGRVGKANFVRFINSAYDAVKAVNEETEAVIHVGQGQDADALEKFFDRLQKDGAKWDAIGLSAFPKWSGLKNDVLIEKTVACVKDLKERYDKPVMIVETGHYNNRPLESNGFLCDFMSQLIEGGASGCFYWEPEVVKDYELGAWNPVNNQPSIALDAFAGLKHSKVPYLMNIAWDMPKDSILQSTGIVPITVKADHIRNRVSQLDLMRDRTSLASAESAEYTFQWQPADKGINLLYAKASSTDGHVAMTDTCTMIVGPLTELGQPTVDEAVETDPALYWSMHLQQAGEYMVVFKHRTPVTCSTRLMVNEDPTVLIKFNATKGNSTAYLSKTFSVDEPGDVQLSIIPAYTKKDMPDVESLMVIPMAGQSLPLAGNVTAVNPVEVVNEFNAHVSGNTLCVSAPEEIEEVLLLNISGQCLRRIPAGGKHVLSAQCPELGSVSPIIVSVRTSGKTYSVKFK